MTFSIIGTGNIAWFFGKRLAAGGHRCKAIYGRDAIAVGELAEALLSIKSGGLDTIKDGDADVCFIAVSDQAIAQIAGGISFKKTVLVHTAGALSIDAIKDSATDCAVLWPVSSVTKTNLPAYRNIPCGWEASSEKAAKYVQALGHSITDILFEAKVEQRKWLHLAAVFCNNFTNHLFTISEQMCNENQIPFDTLMPIIEQTFKKLGAGSPQQSQTGPAVRGDENTLTAHRELLAAFPGRLEIYDAITNSIKDMYGNTKA